MEEMAGRRRESVEREKSFMKKKKEERSATAGFLKKNSPDDRSFGLQGIQLSRVRTTSRSLKLAQSHTRTTCGRRGRQRTRRRVVRLAPCEHACVQWLWTRRHVVCFRTLNDRAFKLNDTPFSLAPERLVVRPLLYFLPFFFFFFNSNQFLLNSTSNFTSKILSIPIKI